MKTKLFMLMMLVTFSVNAQQMYYYYHGEKRNLTVSKSHVNIIIDNEYKKSLDSNFMLQHFAIQHNEGSKEMIQLQFKNSPSGLEYMRILDTLKENTHVNVFPFFERNNTEPIGTSDIFYVKLKEIKDTTLLREIAEQQNVQILRQVKYMPLWHVLSVQNSLFNNSIDASNYFYETEFFASIDPAFLFNFKTNCTNDYEFQQERQWGLKNTKYTQGIDINACNAWTITRGAGINVAVLDIGIHMSHNDLSANIHPLSFNAQSDPSSPTPSVFSNTGRYYYHGTFVAGIIAAIKGNGLNIAGVAPESKIMGVSHDLDFHPNISEELANGIIWAYENGADVINNSWGDGCEGDMNSDMLEEAIIKAMTEGREGKGCVVVFASGNDGFTGTNMNYPGNFHPDILTVGAINMYGARTSFSSYGNELDVVAPGQGIRSIKPYNEVDYDNGTSYSAPHVSGIAALVLSAYPALTRKEVCDIIESTAKKIPEATLPSGTQHVYTYSNTPHRPNGAWNREMGYGLVDAYMALQAAECMVTVFNFANQTVGTDKIINECNINVQNINVISGAKLILDATYETTIESDFEIGVGSELEIK